MSEEFEGNVPDIIIQSLERSFFAYNCRDTGRTLTHTCANQTPLSDKCFDCIGFNKRFTKYFNDSNRCSCGWRIDFGYFMIIFFLDKAGLLPKDFKIMCCKCYNNKKTVNLISITWEWSEL